MPPLKQNHSWTTWLVRGPVLWPMVILVSLSSQMFLFFVVQLLNYLQFFENPWTAACQASLSFTISCRSLLRFRSIESVMPSNHLILCHPLLLLPSVFANIRVCSNEFALCIRWPNYLSFSFSNNPPNEYSGTISFRINWFYVLAVQRTLKSLLQHHNYLSFIGKSFFFLKPSDRMTYICDMT